LSSRVFNPSLAKFCAAGEVSDENGVERYFTELARKGFFFESGSFDEEMRVSRFFSG